MLRKLGTLATIMSSLAAAAPAAVAGPVVVHLAPGRPANFGPPPAFGRPVVTDGNPNVVVRDHRGRPFPGGNGHPGGVVVHPGPGNGGRPLPGGSHVTIGRPVFVPPPPAFGHGRPVGPAFGRDHRIVVVRPAPGNRDDEFLANFFIFHAEQLSCDRLGDLIRNITNEFLAAGTVSDEPTPDEIERTRYNPEERARFFRLRQLRAMLNRPGFYDAVMARLSTAFASCDKQCFDDGEAIGLLSGTGYCNGSLAADGLGDDDGFKAQQRLPLCQTENYVGCTRGYEQAVDTVAGCAAYTTGQYTSTFKHWISQDCHIDNP